MKTNNERATLRNENKPKASKVEVAKPVGVVSLGNARKQNMMDDGQLAQLPAGRRTPTTTSSGN